MSQRNIIIIVVIVVLVIVAFQFGIFGGADTSPTATPPAATGTTTN